MHDDVAARDRCANLAAAQLLIGIYFDAGATPQDAGSLTAYDAARPFSEQSLQLAELVQSDVLTQLNSYGWGIPDDGVISDTSLGGPGSVQPRRRRIWLHLLLLGPAQSGYFATPSQMPGALIEPLFVTDPFEASIASSVAGQRAIAEGIVRGVEQDLNASNSTALTLPAAGSRPIPLAASVIGSIPLIRVWRVSPGGPEQGSITVAAFDPARTARLVLHAGSLQPTAGQSWGVRTPSRRYRTTVPSSPRSTRASNSPTPEEDGSRRDGRSPRSS